MSETIFILFRSSFRCESAPNISHVTVDDIKTLCGRKTADAETREPDSRSDIPPDCIPCRKAWGKLRNNRTTP